MNSSKRLSRKTYASGVAVLVALALPLSHAAAKAEKVHICLAPSTAQVPTGVDAVSAVRESFTSFLTGPSLSVTALTARLESQVREEAKLASCRYLLFTTVKHSRKTTGLLGRIAAGAVQNGAAEIAAYSRTPGGRVVASATSAGAANMAVASQVHERDQLSLYYRLEDANGASLAEKTEKRAATTDGEDVLTPLIQSAAETVVAALKPTV